jgi:NADH-quinone oxidoreductase subunit F
LDAPVAIRSLKRFAAEWFFTHIGPKRKPYPVTRKEKIAVVGAGPAGLTCAYFLSKMGYQTRVFEAQAIGGGMLGIAVPEFRLPRKVIEDEIEYIQNCGVEISYNSPIDVKHTVNDLLAEGYGAVFIAPGAQASIRTGIPGEDETLIGLYYGLRFLSHIRTGRNIQLSGKVLVIGGGNVAIDAARTALRVGASDVQLFYRRTREEMPAWQKDVEEALEEKIVLNFHWAPKRILQKDRKITGMEFVRSRTVYDDDGRARLSVDETSIRTVDADAVIIAIGQAPDASFLSRDSQIERSLWGSLEVDKNKLSTNIPGIFSGGDFITGPSTVIQAIASGRRAAIAIDKYLQGDQGRVEIFDEKTATPSAAGLALDDEAAKDQRRVGVDFEHPQDRIKDFREVEKGYAVNKDAAREANRCLRCDLERERR